MNRVATVVLLLALLGVAACGRDEPEPVSPDRKLVVLDIGDPDAKGHLEALKTLVDSLPTLDGTMKRVAQKTIEEATGWVPKDEDSALAEFEAYTQKNRHRTSMCLRFGASVVLSVAGTYRSGEMLRVEFLESGRADLFVKPPGSVGYHGQGTWTLKRGGAALALRGLQSELPEGWESLGSGDYEMDFVQGTLNTPVLAGGWRYILSRD